MDSDKLDVVNVVNVDVSDNDDGDLGMGCGDCGADKSFLSICLTFQARERLLGAARIYS